MLLVWESYKKKKEKLPVEDANGHFTGGLSRFGCAKNWKKRRFTKEWGEGQWKQAELLFGNSRIHGVKSTGNPGGVNLKVSFLLKIS